MFCFRNIYTTKVTRYPCLMKTLSSINETDVYEWVKMVKQYDAR